GVEIKEVIPLNKEEKTTNKVRVVTKNNLDLTKAYKISKSLFGSATVEIGAAVRSKEFDDMFYYDGNDLGNTYKKDKTSFRLWAPT
ncbi:hypothetical protein KZ287_31510, partial [Escherichia coli]|nr:hypothetical protein [Escherichia coli]